MVKAQPIRSFSASESLNVQMRSGKFSLFLAVSLFSLEVFIFHDAVMLICMPGMLLNAAVMMLHAQRVSIALAVGYSTLSSVPMSLGLKSSMQSGMAFMPTTKARIDLRSLRTKYLHHPNLQINGNFLYRGNLAFYQF